MIIMFIRRIYANSRPNKVDDINTKANGKNSFSSVTGQI